jgi:hypothetical protein
MGIVMRFVLAASAALCLVAPVAFFACSSSDPVASTEQHSTADASTELPNDSANQATETPTDTGDAGTVATDATAVVSDTDAGTACTAESIRESESNNDVASATVLPSTTSVICGRLLKDDPDFIKFVMPEQVGTFGFNVERGGNMKIELFVDGEEQDFFNNGIPFVPGGEYVIKLSANRLNDYRIRIEIN